QAELQQKMNQMQMDYEEKSAKMQLEQGKLQLQASKQKQEFAAKMAEMEAKQNLMQAQTAEILAKIGLDVRKQNLEEYKTATDVAMREVDQDNAIQREQVDTAFRAKQESRADRQQGFTEQQAMREKGNE